MKIAVLNKISFKDSIFVERLLPSSGKIFVKKNDVVNSYDKIGEALVVKESEYVNYSGDVLVSVGDLVTRGDLLSKERKKFFKFKEYIAPINGEVREIDKSKKQILIESKSQNFSLISGVDGEVVDTAMSKSVLIKTSGMNIKGVHGFGSEVCGELLFLSVESVSEKDITENVRGKIIIAKNFTPSAVSKAKLFNAVGFVFASAEYFEIKKYIEEKIPIVVLEGFGNLPFNSLLKNFFQKSNSLFGILRTYENTLVLTGKSLSDFEVDFDIKNSFEEEVAIGDIVQLFSKENFGFIAKVISIQDTTLKVKLLNEPENEVEVETQSVGLVARGKKSTTEI